MTTLDTFLGRKTARTEQAAPSSQGEQSPAVAEAPALTGDPVATPSPEVFQVTDITPSGIEVLYQASPKRLYKVRKPAPYGQSGFPDFYPWVEVPGVTTVLDVLSKDGLPWWAQGIGVAGVLELVKRGLLFEGIDWTAEEKS